MRTDAKNLVTTKRTVHLPEHKWDHSHDFYVTKGSIHVLARIPTKNCLENCLKKNSAEENNLITAVKTGKLLEVDIQHDFKKHSWSTRPSNLPGAKYLCTKEKDV